MREKMIEQKLIKAVKNAGGIAPKLVSPGFDGMPDRMVLMPEGKFGFVEVRRRERNRDRCRLPDTDCCGGWASRCMSFMTRSRLEG